MYKNVYVLRITQNYGIGTNVGVPIDTVFHMCTLLVILFSELSLGTKMFCFIEQDMSIYWKRYLYQRCEFFFMKQKWTSSFNFPRA